MLPKDSEYLHTIGSEHVSITDLEMVNKFYECDSLFTSNFYLSSNLYLAKCTSNTSSMCKNEGIPNPANCDKCICPLGYGGDRCDEIVSIIKQSTQYLINTKFSISAIRLLRRSAIS